MSDAKHHAASDDTRLRLLHVGDEALFRRLEACLAAGGSTHRLSHRDDLPAEVDADVLLLDQARFPAENGVRRRLDVRVPLVLVRPDPPPPDEMEGAVTHGAEDLICLSADDSVELVGRIAAAAARHRVRAEMAARLEDAEDGEARFQRMVQANADGVMIVSRDGTIRYVNEAAEVLFARDADALVGAPFGSPLVSGTTTELDVVLPGGRTTVVELRVVEIPWEGETAHLVSLRDITDRRAAEERTLELAREQEARRQAEEAEAEARLMADLGDALDTSLDLSETLQSLTDALVPRLADWCTLDLAGEGEPARRFVAAGAVEQEELLRRLAADYPLQVDSMQPAARALRTGEPFHLLEVPDDFLDESALSEEHAALLRQLEVASIIAVGLPASRGLVGVLTLVRTGRPLFRRRDVRLATEVARRTGHTVERVRLFREAQAANKAKADFLAVMSHELRTPLNSILGYVDLLQAGISGEMTEEQGEKLGRVKLSAQHLLQLIEEILSYARMEAGREQLRPEPTTLGELLGEVAALTEPLADERGLTFLVEEADGRELVTDVAKVRQILLNLLTNAVKFTEAGEVRLGFEELGDRVRLTVADTGQGIEADNLDRIFEPFWQIERPQTRRAGGTGLGLSVARRLARLLGGDLLASSRPGRGSTFTLEIPRRLVLTADGEAEGAGTAPGEPGDPSDT